MKPGVFTQIYTHLVFAVKYIERLLKKEIRPEVFSYISGINETILEIRGQFL